MEIKNYKEFAKFIDSKDFKGPIIIYGENKEFIKDSINKVYSKVNSFEEFNIVKIKSEELTIDKIVNACETIPFISDKKIVHIKNPQFLRKKEKYSQNDGDNKNSSEINEINNFLLNFITTMDDSVILLVTLVGDIDVKNKVYIGIKNIGNIIQYRLQKPDDIQAWTNEMFKQYGKTINKSDLTYFISEIGNDVEKLQREIDKLCCYVMDEKEIKRNYIDDIINKSLESNIFRMVDDIVKKDIDSAITILNVLLFQKEDFTRIMGMIIRQFRILYQVKLESIRTKNYLEIKDKLKLNEYVVKNLLRQTSRYTEKDIAIALSKCLETDYSVKSGKIQPEIGLEMLLADLCR